jgi:predicted dehydrogenase
MSRPLEGIVIGAGSRGADAYAPLLLEQEGLGRIVAVAEPDPIRRRDFALRYAVPDSGCFAHYEQLLARPRLADFAIIATPDALHFEPAMAAMEQGYHVLLEKPMAVDETSCEALVVAAQRTDRLLQVCHVLRYAPLFEAIKAVIDSGEIGEIVTIQHSENVSYWHYAHSYCRGNWRNRAQSSPMILAKSCHDLDLLYYLSGSPPRRLTSLERPTLLCLDNAPQDAPAFCIEGCRHADVCPYDAVAMYQHMTPLLLDIQRKSDLGPIDAPPAAPPRATGWKGWPVSAITTDPSPEGIDYALRNTTYGRCVYRVGDNDQPASQNVNILFENGVNASFTMHSTSHREGRETRIDATRGSLAAGFYNSEQFVTVSDHKSGRTRKVDLSLESGTHGGADPRLFRGFLSAVRGEALPQTTAAESLWSHRMAFAADRAAREGSVIRWG